MDVRLEMVFSYTSDRMFTWSSYRIPHGTWIEPIWVPSKVHKIQAEATYKSAYKWGTAKAYKHVSTRSRTS